MKNTITIIFTFLCLSITFAQDVKIKKGVISLDKKEVAKIEKQDKVYKISSLDGKTWFLASTINITPNKNVRLKFWLELKGANGNIREVEYEEVDFTFSREKWCVEALLNSNTHLLTLDGIDSEKVSEFFQNTDQSISSKWDAVIIDQKNEIETEAQLALKDKLVIDSKGNISLNEVNIATINKSVKDGVYKVYNYTVSDSNGKKIATSSFYRENDLNKSGISITMFDDTVYPLEQVKASMGNIEFDDFERRMVRKIYAKGYNLQDVSKSINNNPNAASKKVVFESVLNIKDVDGFVIDSENNKLTGKITFEAEPDQQNSNTGIADLSKYGVNVTLLHDGKYKVFKAKDAVKFCAGDICYLGAQGTEDAGLNNASSELDVFGGSSKFFKIVYENEGNYVLVHNNSPKDFYLKLKNQKKAVYLGSRAMFGKRKDDKTKKIFDKYLECSSIDFTNYDTNSIEGLTKVINDYMSTCK